MSGPQTVVFWKFPYRSQRREGEKVLKVMIMVSKSTSRTRLRAGLLRNASGPPASVLPISSPRHILADLSMK